MRGQYPFGPAGTSDRQGKLSCTTCPVRPLNLCQAIAIGSSGDLEAFRLGEARFAPGEMLYGQGDRIARLYNVVSGWVALYRILGCGRRQIIEFALPGAFIGYQAELGDAMLHGAECLTEVTVCQFPRHAFQHFLDRHPAMARRLIHVNARETLALHNQLANVAGRQALARIANLLLELYFRVRATPGDGNERMIQFPLTQDQIADAIGLTNVHVSKTLKQLRDRQLIRLNHRSLEILDLVELAEIADFDLTEAGPAALSGDEADRRLEYRAS